MLVSLVPSIIIITINNSEKIARSSLSYNYIMIFRLFQFIVTMHTALVGNTGLLRLLLIHNVERNYYLSYQIKSTPI